MTYQLINKTKSTVELETQRGVIRAIKWRIWIRTAEMVLVLHFLPSVKFLTFRKLCVEVEATVERVFIQNDQKFHRNWLRNDQFGMVLVFRFLDTFINKQIYDVIFMTHVILCFQLNLQMAIFSIRTKKQALTLSGRFYGQFKKNSDFLWNFIMV